MGHNVEKYWCSKDSTAHWIKIYSGGRTLLSVYNNGLARQYDQNRVAVESIRV